MNKIHICRWQEARLPRQQSKYPHVGQKKTHLPPWFTYRSPVIDDHWDCPTLGRSTSDLGKKKGLASGNSANQKPFPIFYDLLGFIPVCGRNHMSQRSLEKKKLVSSSLPLKKPRKISFCTFSTGSRALPRWLVTNKHPK